MEMNDISVVDNEDHSKKSVLFLSIEHPSKRQRPAHANVGTHFKAWPAASRRHAHQGH